MLQLPKLRLANEGDGPQVVEVFLASFALLTFLPKVHTQEETERFFLGEVKKGGITVAHLDEGIVGFINLSKGWVDHLYISPQYLRYGIGSQLLKFSQTAQSSFKLWCFQENHRGRQFYEAHNFQAVKFTDGSSNEEKIPDILYEWRK